MDNITVRTMLPILMLMGFGFLSRRLKIFKEGDSKVLSSYCYYFAIPAVFFVNLSEIKFSADIIRFVLVAIIPDIAIIAILLICYKIMKFSRNTLLLFIISSVFGSHTFYGIPFINFAFPGGKVAGYEGSIEKIAVLAASAISITSIIISIVILELYSLGNISIIKESHLILKKLASNPLIMSITAGVVVSLLNINIPEPVSKPLRMLGQTANSVAIFLLGVLLYGRKYTNFANAFKLSLLRIIIMPLTALCIIYLSGFEGVDGKLLVLMHGMPLAMTMIIFSEKYNFFEDTVPTLILISSLSSTIYLNIWIWLLGIK